MTDIFLMGTSGSYDDPRRSKWREPIKAECDRFGITYFDPVVPVWNEETASHEVEALLTARILVMAITDETPGVASLAESGWAAASALLRGQAVGLFVDPFYRGKRSTISTMAARIDSIFNNDPNSEIVDEMSRRARTLVTSHARELVNQFPSTTLFIAKDLDELAKWTITTAKKLVLRLK